MWSVSAAAKQTTHRPDLACTDGLHVRAQDPVILMQTVKQDNKGELNHED